MRKDRLAGPLLAQERRGKQIKAEVVARNLKISLPTYSQIEHGHRSLSVELCMAICQELDISGAMFWRRLAKAMKQAQMIHKQRSGEN